MWLQTFNWLTDNDIYTFYLKQHSGFVIMNLFLKMIQIHHGKLEHVVLQLLHFSHFVVEQFPYMGIIRNYPHRTLLQIPNKLNHQFITCTCLSVPNKLTQSGVFVALLNHRRETVNWSGVNSEKGNKDTIPPNEPQRIPSETGQGHSYWGSLRRCVCQRCSTLSVRNSSRIPDALGKVQNPISKHFWTDNTKMTWAKSGHGKHELRILCSLDCSVTWQKPNIVNAQNKASPNAGKK